MIVPIKYAHAGDITTNDAHALAWNVGEIESRYQELAIVNDRVIGSWAYGIEWYRGRPRIFSSRTDVAPRFQRKGIARALWFAGIARWNPSRIEATISTDEGRDFLAHMVAQLAYRTQRTMLWVKQRNEDAAQWEERCGWASQHLLRELGERERERKAVDGRSPKLLKAVP